MEPLTIGLLAGGAYLLAKGAGGPKAPTAVATMSIDQLAVMYVGKPVAGTPPEVNQRFVEHWNQVRASGQEGWVVHGIDPGESARIGPDWHYLVGRLPDASAGWLSPPAPPGLIWRRTDVRKKESLFAKVVGTLIPIVGGVAGTAVGGPAGTAAGSAAGKALSSSFSEFDDFSAYMNGQVKRGPPRRKP